MDFELSEDLIALQDMARRFAAENIAPNARAWDREADIPRDLVAKLGELGFLGVFIPTEYGGCGFGDLAATVVMEEIASCQMALSAEWGRRNFSTLQHILANSQQRVVPAGQTMVTRREGR